MSPIQASELKAGLLKAEVDDEDLDYIELLEEDLSDIDGKILHLESLKKKFILDTNRKLRPLKKKRSSLIDRIDNVKEIDLVIENSIKRAHERNAKERK